MDIEFEQATPEQAAVVADILKEAAVWAERNHGRLWVESELDAKHIQAEVEQGQFFLARCAAQYAGTVRYQLVDELFWPDAAGEDSAYVHRLAVRRQFAGRGLAAAMLHWAAQRARAEGRSSLRLDTDMTRPKLRCLYEACGFRPHSERQVGSYHVMRYELRLDGSEP
jgi:GNAT superfamily N-acetyltransferase